MYRNSENVNNTLDKLCDQIQHTELSDSDEEIAMETDHSYNYNSLVRFLVLQGSVPADISTELLSELNNMYMPQFFGIEDVVSIFSNLFRDYFIEIFESIEDEMDSFEMECATSILSRCVILVGEPSVFTFLLVAAFLDRVIFEGINQYHCFRVLPICEFCLEVLYKRLFHKVFVSQKAYELMVLYCDSLRKEMPDPTLEEFQKTCFGQSYTNIVKKCVEVNSYASFTLTDSEKEMFIEMCYLNLEKRSLSHKFDKDVFLPNSETTIFQWNQNIDFITQDSSTNTFIAAIIIRFAMPD
ncbi:hypothetical protein TNCT_517281 [Trichonephila clavata]|uniref:Uncharacterized protein n=2 Tax=Trichonephila clavata TaxID=2740835 RepID=A0A8X6FH16_TRICU|nr:hypothetical protein TNCT_517281 [Trichonephila clavata]